ncbi:RNA recognition motif domain-containing protein [Pseudoalteromonas xiamenensis]|uniref:RNA-binding protein n=1 Tax=Pseudoalteromonas xiamenensis TaxID=882626 RepID=A0A975HLY6_9GAMM|nr:RNA-binding protein [Pseudoalteromonas xiamenensis]QTH70510.1 RNA-binding protein [Pseudoalteromonas xiamenensis]
MKFPDQRSFIISALLGLIAFFIAHTMSAALQTQFALVVAISTLLGGIITSYFSATSFESATDETIKTKTIYVGNLPYRANESVVRSLFEEQGTVVNVRLLKDKNTGKRRGFGFVEMAEADAEKAIAALNDKEFQQRTLKVREAKQKPEDSEDE